MCEISYRVDESPDVNLLMEKTILGLIRAGILAESDRQNIVSRHIAMFLIRIRFRRLIVMRRWTSFNLYCLSGESIRADGLAPGNTKSETWTTQYRWDSKL